MQTDDQRSAFIRIALASITNVIGFGFATALIAYLTKQTDIGKPVMILAIIVVFIMFVSIYSLIMFIFYTVKGIPSTMASMAGVKFVDVYGYILTALFLRLIEAGICIAYIIYIYRLFYT